MKTFELSFHGREVGAIGVFSGFLVTLQAVSEAAARIKIYETHEHISALHVREIPDSLAPRLPRNALSGWGFENQLPAYRITYSDGDSYVTSMAAGVTLADAEKYFLGNEFTQPDETKKRVVKVEKVR